MVITVAELIEKIKFDVIYTSEDALKKEITTSDVTRPGLEMTGYLEYYTPTDSTFWDESMVLYSKCHW